MKNIFVIAGSRMLKEMLEVSTLSLNAGCFTSGNWLPDWLENSKCRIDHLRSILYSLLPVLDVTDFCGINSRLQIFLEITI